MAEPTKVQVLLNGSPLAGATVILGEVGGKSKITDESGIVAFPDIVAPFESYSEVLVTNSEIYATAKVLITHGQTTVVWLGYATE